MQYEYDIDTYEAKNEDESVCGYLLPVPCMDVVVAPSPRGQVAVEEQRSAMPRYLFLYRAKHTNVCTYT